MRAVDACLLVAALAGSPPAVAFVRGEGPVWVSLPVLAEAVRALEIVHGRTREQMAEALERILDNRDLVLEEPGVARAALEGYRRGLAFEDALAFEVARKAGHLPFATLRPEFRDEPGSTVL
jgi:predicted nucleic-acid-binding protein